MLTIFDSNGGKADGQPDLRKARGILVLNMAEKLIQRRSLERSLHWWSHLRDRGPRSADRSPAYFGEVAIKYFN